MSSDESEEENFCFFGKPLPPYDEDSFPKKRPIAIEEQIATDAQGRRRFHGAFTGGFSAGFYNTVGSLEGWTPSEFKSTRADKAVSRVQKPEDFMDDEDIGEHGIAPQTVRAKKEYSTSKKRKRQVFSDGPIPGEPVLHSILTSGNETVGYLLLKNIGIQDKIAKQEEELAETQKVYGCHIPKQYEISKSIENKQYIIADIYKQFLSKPKSNTFGLGYEGLDKGHLNLFKTSSLVMKDQNNKKVSITGQAFGVGAFEDDDEDIYVKDDMSKYDFELTNEKVSKKKEQQNLILDMFIKSKTPLVNKKLYLPPSIPITFTGKYKKKKSRFEPIKEEELPKRSELNPLIRARYLGEQVNENPTPSTSALPKEAPKEKEKPKKEKEVKETNSVLAGLVFDRFVSASKPEDSNDILTPVERSETEHGTPDMRQAVKIKMFGALTRTTIDWYPCPILCKRFNVPEPLLDKSDSGKKKRTKNLIFEYQKHEDIEKSLRPGLNSNSEQVKTEPEPEPEPEPHTENQANQETVTEPISVEPDPEPEPKPEPKPDPTDITQKLDSEKNIDLFKAVFLSSSESEPEDNSEKKPEDRTEELKNTVLSEQLIPKIKPIKEGILSGTFNFSIKPQHLKETQPIQPVSEPKTDSNCYGPKLPVHPKTNPVTIRIEPSSSSEDEWVEKSDSKKKSKHKDKKKKKKHKKHKHKR